VNDSKHLQNTHETIASHSLAAQTNSVACKEQRGQEKPGDAGSKHIPSRKKKKNEHSPNSHVLRGIGHDMHARGLEYRIHVQTWKSFSTSSGNDTPRICQDAISPQCPTCVLRFFLIENNGVFAGSHCDGSRPLSRPHKQGGMAI